MYPDARRGPTLDIQCDANAWCFVTGKKWDATGFASALGELNDYRHWQSQ
ncbi:MAG: hypothetical protein V4719_14215 [Planctomycetota bacterium]